MFEIAKTATGYGDTATTLVSFPNPYLPGTGPLQLSGPVIADANGDLFGTTRSGGTFGDGTVFEIKVDPTSPTGYAASATIVANFSLGSSYDICSSKFDGGLYPLGPLCMDADGNLYGETTAGGDSNNSGGDGTVFEVAKDSSSPTGYDAPDTLVSFDDNAAEHQNASGTWVFDLSGYLPVGGLISVDGTYYGVTDEGGQNYSPEGERFSRSTTAPFPPPAYPGGFPLNWPSSATTLPSRSPTTPVTSRRPV